MNTFRVLALAFGLACPLSLVGCGEEAKVEKETKITSPGGTSTVTETKKVESTGDHPPIDVKDAKENPSAP